MVLELVKRSAWKWLAPLVGAVLTVRTMRRLVVWVCVVGALFAPAAAGASSSMFAGAVENAPLTPDPVRAKAEVDLARLAGFDALRVSMFWKRGKGSVILAPVLLRLL